MTPIEYKIMIKLVLGMSGAAGGLLMLGTAPVDPAHIGTPYVQYGAMGILALCAVWLVTKIIPDAMKQRQAEVHDMMGALITEREKLVASMEKLVDVHTAELKEAREKQDKLIRDLATSTEAERKEWSALTRDSIEIQTKVQLALTEMTVALRGCQMHNPKLGGFGGQ